MALISLSEGIVDILPNGIVRLSTSFYFMLSINQLALGAWTSVLSPGWVCQEEGVLEGEEDEEEE